MDILTSTMIDLPATRTYKRRECQWFGVDENGFAGVILRLWAGKRAGSKLVERDLYQVVEADPPVGVMARAFVFLNVTDPTQKFPYKVLVGQNNSCTCDAGRAKVPGDGERSMGCKHRDATVAAIEMGWFDGSNETAGVYDDAPGEPTAWELATA